MKITITTGRRNQKRFWYSIPIVTPKMLRHRKKLRNLEHNMTRKESLARNKYWKLQNGGSPQSATALIRWNEIQASNKADLHIMEAYNATPRQWAREIHRFHKDQKRRRGDSQLRIIALSTLMTKAETAYFQKQPGSSFNNNSTAKAD
jgi:hypothetical protein